MFRVRDFSLLEMSLVQFEGSNCLRQRLILSTVTSRPISIKNIRSSGEEPGLNESEVTLLKLLEKVSNGMTVEVDESGTELFFTPGVLIGGRLEHDCGLKRSIAYYLEVLLFLAPFCKYPLDVTLTGITNDDLDPGVDVLKTVHVGILRKFMKCVEPSDVEVTVLARGLKPNGGGSVNFKSVIRRVLKPIQWLDAGKIKRVRGVSFACRVSPQVANRMVDTSKGLLLKFLPDVYIHTEHMKGPKSGRSPGFGLVLFAETTGGAIYSGEAYSKVPKVCSNVSKVYSNVSEVNSNVPGSYSNVSEVFSKVPDVEEAPSVPEDVATEATQELFEEIYRGGCTDSSGQGLALFFMAHCESDLSKIQLGPLSPFSIHLLRLMKDMLSITFKLDAETPENKIGAQKVRAACIGVGFSNLNKIVS